MCVPQEERDSLIQEVIEKNGGFKVLYYIHVHVHSHIQCIPCNSHCYMTVCVCVCAGLLW